MQTRRLTITLRPASRRAPVARLTVTIAGQQLRRQTDGDRQREQRRLQQRAAERDVDDEDRARQHAQ